MFSRVQEIQNRVRQSASFLVIAGVVKINSFCFRHQRPLLTAAGAVMLFDGTAGVAHAAAAYDHQIIFGLCRVMALSQGMFGALVMSVAGLVAIVGAAVGSYKTSMNAVAVGAGAYLIKPMVLLFFGDPNCAAVDVFFLPVGGGGAGAGGGAKP